MNISTLNASDNLAQYLRLLPASVIVASSVILATIRTMPLVGDDTARATNAQVQGFSHAIACSWRTDAMVGLEKLVIIVA
jgi:hypothetical protein